MHEPLIPDEAAHLMAAIAFRHDVQAALARSGRARNFGSAVTAAGAALAIARSTGMGADPAVLYRNLIDVVVAAEDVAIRLRVANPEMRLAA